MPELAQKPGLVAYSRKQNLRAVFASDGVRVSPSHNPRLATVRLTPTRLSRGASRTSLPSATPTVQGNRVEYARGPVTEWYVNDEHGLEQGFAVASRQGAVGSRAPMVLSLAVDGALRPEAQADGQSVVFRDPKSSASLLYDGLKAWDVRGKVLPSHLSVTEPGSKTPSLHHSNTPASRQATQTAPP